MDAKTTTKGMPLVQLSAYSSRPLTRVAANATSHKRKPTEFVSPSKGGPRKRTPGPSGLRKDVRAEVECREGEDRGESADREGEDSADGEEDEEKDGHKPGNESDKEAGEEGGQDEEKDVHKSDNEFDKEAGEEGGQDEAAVAIAGDLADQGAQALQSRLVAQAADFAAYYAAPPAAGVRSRLKLEAGRPISRFPPLDGRPLPLAPQYRPRRSSATRRLSDAKGKSVPGPEPHPEHEPESEPETESGNMAFAFAASEAAQEGLDDGIDRPEDEASEELGGDEGPEDGTTEFVGREGDDSVSDVTIERPGGHSVFDITIERLEEAVLQRDMMIDRLQEDIAELEDSVSRRDRHIMKHSQNVRNLHAQLEKKSAALLKCERKIEREIKAIYEREITEVSERERAHLEKARELQVLLVQKERRLNDDQARDIERMRADVTRLKAEVSQRDQEIKEVAERERDLQAQLVQKERDLRAVYDQKEQNLKATYDQKEHDLKLLVRNECQLSDHQARKIGRMRADVTRLKADVSQRDQEIKEVAERERDLQAQLVQKERDLRAAYDQKEHDLKAAHELKERDLRAAYDQKEHDLKAAHELKEHGLKVAYGRLERGLKERDQQVQHGQKEGQLQGEHARDLQAQLFDSDLKLQRLRNIVAEKGELLRVQQVAAFEKEFELQQLRPMALIVARGEIPCNLTPEHRPMATAPSKRARLAVPRRRLRLACPIKDVQRLSSAARDRRRTERGRRPRFMDQDDSHRQTEGYNHAQMPGQPLDNHVMLSDSRPQGGAPAVQISDDNLDRLTQLAAATTVDALPATRPARPDDGETRDNVALMNDLLAKDERIEAQVRRINELQIKLTGVQAVMGDIDQMRTEIEGKEMKLASQADAIAGLMDVLAEMRGEMDAMRSKIPGEMCDEMAAQVAGEMAGKDATIAAQAAQLAQLRKMRPVVQGIVLCPTEGYVSGEVKKRGEVMAEEGGEVMVEEGGEVTVEEGGEVLVAENGDLGKESGDLSELGAEAEEAFVAFLEKHTRAHLAGTHLAVENRVDLDDPDCTLDVDPDRTLVDDDPLAGDDKCQAHIYALVLGKLLCTAGHA